MLAYLDACVIVPLFVAEPTSTTMVRFMAAKRASLMLSDFGASEVASALARLHRSRDLDPDQVEEALRQFDRWRIENTRRVEMTTADLALADGYVRRFEFKLQTPDAIHFAVANRLDAALVHLR